MFDPKLLVRNSMSKVDGPATKQILETSSTTMEPRRRLCGSILWLSDSPTYIPLCTEFWLMHTLRKRSRYSELPYRVRALNIVSGGLLFWRGIGDRLGQTKLSRLDCGGGFRRPSFFRYVAKSLQRAYITLTFPSRTLYRRRKKESKEVLSITTPSRQREACRRLRAEQSHRRLRTAYRHRARR